MRSRAWLAGALTLVSGLRTVHADSPLFLTSAPETAIEDLFYTYLVRVSDLQADNPVISLTQGPTGMTISDTSAVPDSCTEEPLITCAWRATVTWLPDNSHAEQDHAVSLLATDAGNSSTSQSYTLYVENSNDAPQPADDRSATDEDTPVTINVLANDTDPDPTSDPLTVHIHIPPTNGEALVNLDQSITYTPHTNYYGPDELIYEVSDGSALETATVDIDIAPVNDPPTWVAPTPSGTLTSHNGESFVFTLRADDPDSFEIVYAAGGLPESATVDEDSGEVEWLPDYDEAGDWSITLSASDAFESIYRDLTLRVTFTDDDLDGIPDGWEVENGLDPTTADSDGDTIADGCEAGDLESPADTDLDTTLDALDLDSDDDGVDDAAEAGDADLATPPVDTDNDQTPDYRDLDSDDDTVPDGEDNCRVIANTDQADVDDDGEGDVCEDADGDGVPDLLDACPHQAAQTADGCPPSAASDDGGCDCHVLSSSGWLLVALAVVLRRRRRSSHGGVQDCSLVESLSSPVPPPRRPSGAPPRR